MSKIKDFKHVGMNKPACKNCKSVFIRKLESSMLDKTTARWQCVKCGSPYPFA